MSQPLPVTLLDTDTLSAVMRQHPIVLVRARAYLAIHRRLTFSITTRYEVLRGLHANHATAQLAAFDRLCVVKAIADIALPVSSFWKHETRRSAWHACKL